MISAPLLANAASWPAIWSAVAATFSAIASIVLMRVHLANRIDSVRPDLIAEDWSMEEEDLGWATIRIGRISNLGKGPALHFWGGMKIAGAAPPHEGGPFVGFFFDHFPNLFPGVGTWSGCYAKFQWKGASSTPEPQLMVPLRLTLRTSDYDGRLHSITYELIAVKGNANFGGIAPLAKNLYLMRRTTTIESAWWVKQRSRVNAWTGRAKNWWTLWRRRAIGLYERIRDFRD